MIIYLTGIDGAGKSTIMQSMVEQIFPNEEIVTIWARYRPRMVKMLISRFKKKYISEDNNGQAVNQQEYSDWHLFKKKITGWKVISRTIFLLQSVDYLAQLMKVRKIINQNKGKTIIIDRYTLDFIVDQTINHGNIENHFVTRIFLKKLYELDRIFLITVNETVAFERKNDIPSIEYLRERSMLYTHYMHKLPNGVIIDNNKNIDEALNKIKSYCVI
ncbi:MAG: hypothetical protein HXX13_10540 [Bacteroidetes bacterium]|nr:hypothetical protein [Bacteroidota bacterium]